MFRHFYLQSPDGSEFDAIEDGANACAFFVSSVLTIFNKIEAVHGTIASTIKDLEQSGWQVVEQPSPGDVIVWAPSETSLGHAHIGFYVGKNEAISTSASQREVIRHELNFGSHKRKITHIYHLPNWEQT